MQNVCLDLCKGLPAVVDIMTDENIIADDIEHFIAILSVQANPPVIPSNIAVNNRSVYSMQSYC